MRILKLPFDIGTDYEELELVLEILADRIEGYDSYIYIGEEVQCILNFPADKIELIFHWDVLKAVIVSFKNGISFQTQLNWERIKASLLEEQTEILISENYFKVIFENQSLYFYISARMTYLIYGDSKLVAKLCRTLLC